MGTGNDRDPDYDALKNELQLNVLMVLVMANIIAWWSAIPMN